MVLLLFSVLDTTYKIGNINIVKCCEGCVKSLYLVE